jgi:hypothetical protein
VIWLYGICDRPELPVPHRRGLAQAPLDGLAHDGLMAVFTRHGAPVGDPAPDALWAHERVVERLMTDRTVLPLRFGSTLAGEGELLALLAGSRTSFAAALARVSGRVELAVRALEPAPTPVAVAGAPSGRDYLLGKLRNGRRADGLHEPLAALAAMSERRPGGGGDDELLRAAYLVERPAVARFRAAVERLQRAHPDLAILCTGPWPPYSFVS